MKKILVSTLLIFACHVMNAQNNADISLQKPPYRYDTDFLSKEFHADRRAALRKEMPANSAAIFFSNPIRNRSGDVDYDYHQDPNFYYLSGHTEPNSVLVVFKEPHFIENQLCSEALFLEERNPFDETWNGRTLGTAEAKQTLGITTLFKNTEFLSLNFSFQNFSKVLVNNLWALDTNLESKGNLYLLQKQFSALLGNEGKSKCDAASLDYLMGKLREVKQPEELKLMRKAISISCLGHIELIKSLHKGMTEYQAQSILEYEFKSNGAEFVGYPSIVGNGENSCMLHYTSNRKQLNGEQFLLFDAGAEYHGYTADITRTVPVDGIFSVEEKAIYDLVLAAQEAAIKVCIAGNKFNAGHFEAVKIIQEGLIKLGIISTKNEYHTYFMHGTSHYLGLEAHDVGLGGNLKAGNIITVEPGIYIPEGAACDKKWWNIGVRIEDDILITDGEPENLSQLVPRKSSEIEDLMKEKGFFEKQ